MNAPSPQRFQISLRTLMILTLIVGGVMALAVLAERRFERSMDIFDAGDATIVITADICNTISKEGLLRPEQIEAHLLFLQQASVINRCGQKGDVATDPFGTPFKVKVVTTGSLCSVTATSAGPDEVFGTSDDIVNTRQCTLPGSTQ
jgi:hypothetical protein